MLATCQLRSFNAPTYSQSVLRLHYWKHEFFPCIQTIFFLFLLAIKKILLIRLQVSHNTQHSRSVITRNICIKFRVLKVTRQTFGLCLTPACPIFKAENFSMKVVLNEKIMSKSMTQRMIMFPKEYFYSTRECKNTGMKKISFPSSEHINLSFLECTTFHNYIFFAKILSLILVLVYFYMSVSKNSRLLTAKIWLGKK